MAYRGVTKMGTPTGGQMSTRSTRYGRMGFGTLVVAALVSGCTGAASAPQPPEPTTPTAPAVTTTPAPTTPATSAPAGPPIVPGTQVKLAVTFAGREPSRWVHASTGVWRAEVVTVGAGRVASVDGSSPPVPQDVASLSGLGSDDLGAGSFPEYSDRDDAADFAAIVVTPAATANVPLYAPQQKDFTFGADVLINRGTPSSDARRADNGNNVVQRGLAGDDQYKIQLDAHSNGFVPACVLREGGFAEVEAEGEPIEAGQWHRLRCTRYVEAGVETVALVVTGLGSGGAERVYVSESQRVTDLDFALVTAQKPIPLSVGGKVKADGRLFADASDQFNGRIDNVYLAIG